jgi:hypothetical protein
MDCADSPFQTTPHRGVGLRTVVGRAPAISCSSAPPPSAPFRGRGFWPAVTASAAETAGPRSAEVEWSTSRLGFPRRDARRGTCQRMPSSPRSQTPGAGARARESQNRQPDGLPNSEAAVMPRFGGWSGACLGGRHGRGSRAMVAERHHARHASAVRNQGAGGKLSPAVGAVTDHPGVRVEPRPPCLRRPGRAWVVDRHADHEPPSAIDAVRPVCGRQVYVEGIEERLPALHGAASTRPADHNGANALRVGHRR